MKTRFLFDVPQEKKLRVIIDTDAACEADDPFAIVQAFSSLINVFFRPSVEPFSSSWRSARIV